MSSFSAPDIIRGYHVYQRIWTPFIGEKAATASEPGNEHDPYAVVVLEDQTLYTVGHLFHVKYPRRAPFLFEEAEY